MNIVGVGVHCTPKALPAEMQRDLNSCTARQLTSIPGIEPKLAENIVKYRHAHGSFNHFDELWRVIGMSRPKYYILSRHLNVPGEKPPVMGARLPYAKLSLCGSTMDFICQGRSLPKSHSKVTTKNPSGYKSPDVFQRLSSKTLSRTYKKTKPVIPLEAPTSPQAKYGVPVTKILVKQTKRPGMTGILKNLSKSKDSDKLNDGSPEKEPNDKEQTIPDTVHNIDNSNLDLLQTLLPPRLRHAWTSSPEKPKVTLKTSASGNNVNLSCSIDKRLIMNQSSPVAFQLQENEITPTGEYRQPQVTPEAEEMEQSPEPSAEVQQTAELEQNHLPILGRSTEIYSSLLVTKGSSSASSGQLIEENMLLYERQNTMNEPEKKRMVDDWIIDVNKARELDRLLRGRDRVHQERLPRSDLPQNNDATINKKFVSPSPERNRSHTTADITMTGKSNRATIYQTSKSGDLTGQSTSKVDSCLNRKQLQCRKAPVSADPMSRKLTQTASSGLHKKVTEKVIYRYTFHQEKTPEPEGKMVVPRQADGGPLTVSPSLQKVSCPVDCIKRSQYIYKHAKHEHKPKQCSCQHINRQNRRQKAKPRMTHSNEELGCNMM